MSVKTKIHTRRYSNGFTACVVPCGGIAAQVELCVKTGSIHEGSLLGCGSSHFLEHMLFQGCRNYPGRSVSDTVSRLGGNMNAYTSFDRTDYHIFLPARHVDKAIDILTSMVQYPELPEDICRSEKEVILRECDLSLDNPGTMLIRNLIENVYQKHPVRVPVIGYKQLIEQVTREQLISYHKKRYTPERSFMVAAGNVEPEMVFDLIGKAVENWQQGSPFEEPLPAEEPQYWMRESCFTFPDNLARVAVGLRPCTSPADIAAHNILWGAIGMGSAGILPVKFMVNDPLALDLRSFDCNIPGGGISAISAVAKDKDIGKLCSGILKELKKISNGDISDAAVKQEQTQQYAEKLRRAKDIENIAGELVDNFVANGSADTGEYLFNEIMKVTPDDVRRVAAKELDEKLFSVIIQHTAGNNAKKKSKPSTSGKPAENSFKNGNFYCCTDRDVPQISLALVMPAGPLFDPENKTGLSSMAIKMLSTGTEKMSEEKLLLALDRCGADFYAQCHANSAICQLTVPKKHFKRAFDILVEQLFSSSFRSDIFEREREKTADILRHKQLTPLPLAVQRAGMLLTSNHPSALGKDGSLETLAALDCLEAKNHLAKMLNAGNVKVGFAGDITPDEAEKYASRLTSYGLGSGKLLTPADDLMFTSTPLDENIPIDREQSAVVMSIAGTSSTFRQEQIAVSVLRQLENGLGSRLFEMVREDNSLAYSVGLNITSGLKRGILTFHAKTAKGKKERVLELFSQELERLKNHGITPEEFTKAKEQAAFALAGNFSTPAYILPEILLDLYYGYAPADTPEKVEKLYLDYTPDEFYQVFDPIFSNAVPVTVAAGNI